MNSESIKRIFQDPERSFSEEAEERYQQDPIFNRVVILITNLLRDSRLDREAFQSAVDLAFYLDRIDRIRSGIDFIDNYPKDLIQKGGGH